MWYMAEARLADGTPLVAAQEVAPFEEAKTPWYADCRWGIALFALLLLGLSIWDRRRGKMTYWVDTLLIIIYLILIAISVFLTFFSVHPLVGFNWRLLLFPFIHLCARLISLRIMN